MLLSLSHTHKSNHPRTRQVACWVAQFVGHGVFEGRRPALLDNVAQAFFMAPVFVLLEVRGWCAFVLLEVDGRRERRVFSWGCVGRGLPETTARFEIDATLMTFNKPPCPVCVDASLCVATPGRVLGGREAGAARRGAVQGRQGHRQAQGKSSDGV